MLFLFVNKRKSGYDQVNNVDCFMGEESQRSCSFLVDYINLVAFIKLTIKYYCEHII